MRRASKEKQVTHMPDPAMSSTKTGLNCGNC